MQRPMIDGTDVDASQARPVWSGLEAMEPRLLMAATPASKLRILDAAGAEGSAANPGQIVFVVKRLGSTTSKAVVKYRTIALQSADAAVLGADLQAVAGKLVFKPGQKTKQIVVSLIGDGVAEDSKKFGVQLFKPKKTKLAKAVGVGTILDDDSATPTLAINDIAVIEGNNGTKTVFFQVTLSKSSNQVVTVQYKSSAGSATAPEDYIAVPLQTLTFQPGETVKSIPVQIVGDTIPAQKLFETFFITLSNPTNAVLGKAVGTGTIEDNDRPDSRV